MSSWLRNIQGQLSDLATEVLSEANEVLNEAREEVSDPDTELTVAKKKCAEAEKLLAISEAKVKSLEEEKKNLEQQIYDADVEMDTIDTKYQNMVQQRDEDIKRLKVQLEQINEAGWNNGSFIEDDGITQQINDLKKEVAHWKSLVGTNSEDTVSTRDFEKKMDELRQKKEDEIQALIESHADSIVELREMYEEKIQSPQHYNASSSTSNTDGLDAVLLDKEDFMEGKKKLEEMVRSKTSTNGSESERPVVVDLGSRDELVDERLRQLEIELEQAKDEKNEAVEDSKKTIENLKSQNQELAGAYNDLNEEFEDFKRQNSVVETRNADLNNRIDSLKANLIEYEERYEICKRENLETVSKLERLSAEFDRLRSGIENVSTRRQNCDTMVNEEVEKLRSALEESKADRERLRGDVEKFQVAVGEIDVELEKLRDSNRRLLAENQALTQNMETYDTTMRSIISSSEQDIGEFREQFRNIKETHQTERENVLKENDELRTELESVKRQNEYHIEESRLLREVNDKLKTKSDNEDARAELLEQKIGLLENLREELQTELMAEKQEVEQLKKDVEEKKQEVASIEQKNEQKILLHTQTESSTDEEKDSDPLKAEIRSLSAQLSEALNGNTEKSDECEKLKKTTRELEKEIDIRQNCVDEMIAQTNTLQLQQQNLTTENAGLRNEILSREREYLRLEQQLAHERDNTQELTKVVRNLENIITGVGEESHEESTVLESGIVLESDEESRVKRVQIQELKTGCEVMQNYIKELKKEKEENEEELKLLKEKLEMSSKESSDVQKRLENELREAEEVDRGLLEGIEKRLVVMENELTDKIKELAESRKREQELQNVVKELEAKSEEKRGDGEQEDLKAQNEELKTALLEKHNESVEYFKQLEQCLQRNQELEAELANSKQKLEEERRNLTTFSESFEKRGKELERLKEHLMIVEENSTREAVEAEHRESELRERIRELETSGNAVAEGANETTQQYQVQIASIASKLESVERSASEWKSKYYTEEKARELTQEALTSLQNVVRELSIDHERDSAAASHRNMKLQAEIDTFLIENYELREELDRQSIGRQASDDEVLRLKSQIGAKQKIIEELEVQCEELRSPVKSSKTSESYRVDDTTLRQLFLNYFMAEPSKRSDIALLLASILEYPPDEMEKFRNAVRQSFGQSSSFFSGRGQQPPASLTEQFIRFLEVESESSRTAPNLPVRAQAEPPPQISMDRSSPSSGSNLPQSSSSAAALDSLLR